MDYHTILKSLKPEHKFFIGLDSDGCVFDSMEVKQKEFFIPNALKYFDLFPISKKLRETWEFVNLYSISRGGNRFISLLKVFDLLSQNEQVKESGIRLPDMSSLSRWVKSENKLGNDNLRKHLEKEFDPELEKVLIWSEAVNKEIDLWLHNIPPFPQALKAIKNISASADLVIVSQTPLEALDREWHEHNLKGYVRAIAGQEFGTKTEQIALAAKGKYNDDKILMIGDAKGDYEASTKNGILFYPIIPGEEDNSWRKFMDEGFERFINGSFTGVYQDELLNEFWKYLPEM